jgi:hypothetical protein
MSDLQVVKEHSSFGDERMNDLFESGWVFLIEVAIE